MLLLLSNSKEIKQETENKHWDLSELMVILVFQWAAFLGGAVHHWCGAGTGSAVTLGRFSHWDERAGPAAMHGNQMSSTRHKATSNLTLGSYDLKRTRSHLAQTALENKSIALAKEIYFKHKWQKNTFFTSHGRQYQYKSSALALLWMVNKTKKWICLAEHQMAL